MEKVEKTIVQNEPHK